MANKLTKLMFDLFRLPPTAFFFPKRLSWLLFVTVSVAVITNCKAIGAECTMWTPVTGRACTQGIPTLTTTVHLIAEKIFGTERCVWVKMLVLELAFQWHLASPPTHSKGMCRSFVCRQHWQVFRLKRCRSTFFWVTLIPIESFIKWLPFITPMHAVKHALGGVHR